MAKNIFQTKKRVSHFQKTHKQFESENELLGCKDYVSSIIQDMDSNFGYIQSGYLNGSKIHNETQDFQSIPVLQIPEPTSSNSSFLIPAKPKRTKGFSLSRKFPLMEKTQKTLKQLKHNQNIPKPRAHLAGLPKSPARRKAKCTTPEKSSIKKKEIVGIKNKVSSTPCNLPSNNISASNVKTSLNKTSKKVLVHKHSDSEKIKSNISVKSTLRDIPDINDSNNETNKTKDNICVKSSLRDLPDINNSTIETSCIPESDNSTSDSEYERFVKKSKKGLRKKNSKRQKVTKRKSQSCSKSSKRKKDEHVSEQNDALNKDNVTESFTNSMCSIDKSPRNVQVDAYLENDSNCPDHDDVLDMPTRDSSSESDDDSTAISKARQTITNSCEIDTVCETLVLSSENSCNSHPNLNALKSNKNSVIFINETQTNLVQNATKNVGETEISPASDIPESYQILHASETNINSGKVQNENVMSSIKIETVKTSLPSNLIIDICDSDDESSKVELNPPESIRSENLSCSVEENPSKSLADFDSEESDLEIIEEVKKPVQTVDNYSVSVLDNASGCLKNVNIGGDSSVPNACVDVKLVVKTEDLDSKSSVNLLSVVKNQNDTKIEHDVVYKTEICHNKIKMEQRMIVNSHCSSAQNMPDISDSIVVKHEIESDDEIIILDSTCSAKVGEASCSLSTKTENIKLEPSSESKLKLFDFLHSDTKIDEVNEWGEKFQDVIPISSVELYKWYKMEYDTYMEMKKANADVETSLQNLKARQAQKMLYVRHLFHKAMKDNQNVKPPTGSAPLSLAEMSKDSEDFTSVNVPNNDIAPNNSFSLNSQVVLSSEAVQDVKPDVSQLKERIHSIQPKVESNQEDLNSQKIIPKVESDDKQTLKLLTEKCNVCGKDAVAACQRCAKVFFCSHECGRKFWIEGHVKVCGTK